MPIQDHEQFQQDTAVGLIGFGPSMVSCYKRGFRFFSKSETCLQGLLLQSSLEDSAVGSSPAVSMKLSVLLTWVV